MKSKPSSARTAGTSRKPTPSTSRSSTNARPGRPTSRASASRRWPSAFPPTPNLLRLFCARLKREANIEDTKVIKAWQEDLTKRVEPAREADQTLPVELYQALYRPTEVSLQIIRWQRSMLFRPTSCRAALETLRLLMLKSM